MMLKKHFNAVGTLMLEHFNCQPLLKQQREAIRLIGARGRKKESLPTWGEGSRLAGGNEFIADLIYRQTGRTLGRKQVSSHIQVLKPKLRSVPDCESFFLPRVGLKHSTVFLLGMQYVKWHTNETADRKNGRKNKERSTHHGLTGAFRSSHRDTPPLTPPEVWEFDTSQAPSLREVQFRMFLCDTATRQEEHHVYTEIQSETESAPRAFHALNNWRPMHALLQPNGDHGFHCPIYLFEAGINPRKEHVPSTSLKIDFKVVLSKGAFYTDWRLKDRICEEGGPLEIIPDKRVKPEMMDNDALGLYLDLQVLYWRDLFHSFRTKGYIASTTWHERNWGRRLGKILIIQELWATPQSTNAKPQRLAILLWKFHQANKGQAPTTSWRRLTLSATSGRDDPSSFRYYHPRDSPEGVAGPHLPPDCSTSQDSPGSCMPQQVHDASVEANGSLEPDFNGPVGSSMPSSTSTSFPSSISGSTFQTQPSQQSSFDSQEECGTYLSFDAFTASYSLGNQPNDFDLDHAMILSQEDLSYDSYRTLYGSQCQQDFCRDLPEFPAFESSYATQDFGKTGTIPNDQHIRGEAIQISCDSIPGRLPGALSQTQEHGLHEHAQRESLNQAYYVSPLLAPRPRMSQPQILQEEYFEKLQSMVALPPHIEPEHSTLDIVKDEPVSPGRSAFSEADAVPGQQPPLKPQLLNRSPCYSDIEGFGQAFPQEASLDEQPRRCDGSPDQSQTHHLDFEGGSQETINMGQQHAEGFVTVESQGQSHTWEPPQHNDPPTFATEPQGLEMATWGASQQSDQPAHIQDYQESQSMSFDRPEDFNYVGLDDWHADINPHAFQLVENDPEIDRTNEE